MNQQPAWPYQRRLQSLRAAGWTVPELARHTQLSHTAILRISDGTAQHLTRQAANAIHAAWESLSHQPVKPAPPSVTANYWPLPLEWDNIDDPDETPTSHRRVPAAQILYMLDYLHQQLGSSTQVGAYCGISKTTALAFIKLRQKTIKKELACQITASFHAYCREQLDQKYTEVTAA